ncbi:unnamed protein product [Closterium sp. Naga37s-1]|nr:unnamed protein product [Closterium sp. Naga37s-1]
MKLLPPIAAAALLLVAVAVAARVPAANAAGWVELDLTQTGTASDAALAQRAAGIAVEQYNAQTYNAQTKSALSLAAVESAEVFVPADVGWRAVIRVAFTAGEEQGVLRRLLRGPGSTVAVQAEIAGTSHELHHYKLERFVTTG